MAEGAGEGRGNLFVMSSYGVPALFLMHDEEDLDVPNQWHSNTLQLASSHIKRLTSSAKPVACDFFVLEEQREAEAARAPAKKNKKKTGAARFADVEAQESTEKEVEMEEKAATKKPKKKAAAAASAVAKPAPKPKDEDSGSASEAEEVSTADSVELAAREHEEAAKLQGIPPRLLSARETVDGFKCQAGRPIEFRCDVCLKPKAISRTSCNTCKPIVATLISTGKLQMKDVKITLKFHPARKEGQGKKDAAPKDPFHEWMYELVDPRDPNQKYYKIENKNGMLLAEKTGVLPIRGTTSNEWKNIVLNKNRLVRVYQDGSQVAIPIMHQGAFLSMLKTEVRAEMEKFCEEVDRRMVYDLMTISDPTVKDFVPPQLTAAWKKVSKQLLPPTPVSNAETTTTPEPVAKKETVEKKAAPKKSGKEEAQEETKAAPKKEAKSATKKSGKEEAQEESKPTPKKEAVTPKPNGKDARPARPVLKAPEPDTMSVDSGASATAVIDQNEYAALVDEFNASLASVKKLVEDLTPQQKINIFKQAAPVLSKMTSKKALHEMRGMLSGTDSMVVIAAVAMGLLSTGVKVPRRFEAYAPVVVANHDHGEENDEQPSSAFAFTAKAKGRKL